MPFASASWRSRRMVLRLRAASAARKSSKRRIAGVLPMKLLIGALQESEFAEETEFRLGRKGDVNAGCVVDAGKARSGRRPAPGGRLGAAGPGRTRSRASGRRRERHGDLELRIVAAAGALISLGPAAVEHVFAARMALEVAGRGGKQRAVGGLSPADAGPASRMRPPTDFEVFQGRQKIMRNERVIDCSPDPWIVEPAAPAASTVRMCHRIGARIPVRGSRPRRSR